MKNVREDSSCDNCVTNPCPHKSEKENMIPGLKITMCSEYGGE